MVAIAIAAIISRRTRIRRPEAWRQA